jgi:hypothetical protein
MNSYDRRQEPLIVRILRRLLAPLAIVAIAVALGGCGGSITTHAAKPTVVAATTCKYTEAGMKLCGEAALEYCQQVATPGIHGCGAISVEIQRRHEETAAPGLVQRVVGEEGLAYQEACDKRAEGPREIFNCQKEVEAQNAEAAKAEAEGK